MAEENFLEAFATALANAVDLTADDFSTAEETELLDLARIVAHGTERKNAPLATYLAGQYVAIRGADDVTSARAVAEVLEIANDLLADE